MYTLTPNTRLIVCSISSVVAVGLGYWIYKNYPKYLSCGKHCGELCNEKCKNNNFLGFDDFLLPK